MPISVKKIKLMIPSEGAIDVHEPVTGNAMALSVMGSMRRGTRF